MIPTPGTQEMRPRHGEGGTTAQTRRRTPPLRVETAVETPGTLGTRPLPDASTEANALVLLPLRQWMATVMPLRQGGGGREPTKATATAEEKVAGVIEGVTTVVTGQILADVAVGWKTHPLPAASVPAGGGAATTVTLPLRGGAAPAVAAAAVAAAGGGGKTEAAVLITGTGTTDAMVMRPLPEAAADDRRRGTTVAAMMMMKLIPCHRLGLRMGGVMRRLLGGRGVVGKGVEVMHPRPDEEDGAILLLARRKGAGVVAERDGGGTILRRAGKQVVMKVEKVAAAAAPRIV